MTRLPLVLLACVLLAPRLAMAAGDKVALVPVVTKGTGAETRQAVEAALVEWMGQRGIDVLPSALVSPAVGSCEHSSCDGEELRIAAETGADVVVQVSVVKEQGTYTIEVEAFVVETETNAHAGGTAEPQALLAVAAKLLSQVLPGPDPCEGVTCSGHGTCAAPSGEATCDCSSGYVRQHGTECTRITVVTDGGSLLLEPGAEIAIKGRSMAIAGTVLSVLGLVTFTGSFVALSLSMRPGGELRAGGAPGATAALAMGAAALGLHLVAVPLLLGSNAMMRKAVGVEGWTKPAVASWVLYALSAGFVGSSFVRQVSFAFAVVAIPIVLDCAFLGLYEARRAVLIAREGATTGSLAAAPFISPVKGGAIAGIGGVF